MKQIFINKIKFNDLKLKNKIILIYVLLILSTFSIVGYFLYNGAKAFVKSQVSTSNYELIKQLNNNIDTTLDELKRITLILSSDRNLREILHKERGRPVDEFLKDDQFMAGKFNEVTGLRPYIEGIYIFSYNGETYQYRGSNSSIRTDYLFTRTNWFNTMKKLDLRTLLIPSYIPDEILSEGTPKKVISYISEITDNKSGESIGYILIHINNKIFENLFQTTNVGDYLDFVIIDPNKTILYHKDSDFISTQFRSNYISNLLQQKSGKLFEKIDGQTNLIVFHQSNNTQWTIIGSVPLKTVYKDIINLRYIVISLILLSILISIILSILFSNSVTKPIFRLKKYMKEVEGGNFAKTIPIESMDEIGELSQSFNQMIIKIDSLIQRVYKTEILKQEAELNALQAQINPHFLYNTLQIMDIMAEDEGIEAISTLCQNLSKIFRYSISQGKELVEISKELEHAQNYIYIQKTRFLDKFNVIYQVDQSLLKYKILKLIIQPLIENAILHGVENRQGRCTIIIDISKEEDSILIRVMDNGKGMTQEELETLRASLNEEIIHAEIYDNSRRSIGIKNVNSRIKLYFGEQYGVFIESELNVGTNVTIRIPITE